MPGDKVSHPLNSCQPLAGLLTRASLLNPVGDTIEVFSAFNSRVASDQINRGYHTVGDRVFLHNGDEIQKQTSPMLLTTENVSPV